MGELSFSGLDWTRKEFNVFFEAMTAAKTHQFSDDEDFQENMKLDMIDFSGQNVLEKVIFKASGKKELELTSSSYQGFFVDLEKHFEQLAKFPYEVGGVSFRSCKLDDKTVEALRPALCKLKSLVRADFSKNLIKEEG